MNLKKIFNLSRKTKMMLSGGINRKGQAYIYAGIKDKSGLSTGASFGTKGKQLYGSYNRSGNQVRIMKNLTTGRIKSRLRWK